LTLAADFPSSWQFLKTKRFGDANRRGSPSRIEGLGSSIDGDWGRVPQWVWAKPKVLFCHAEAWFGFANKPRRARPNEIWYNVLDQ